MKQLDPEQADAPPPDRIVRVLVADDHSIIRLAICDALGDGFEVCAEAVDADGAVEAALREQPDICLLDVGMPGNGISAAARITAQVPRAAVVMFSARGDEETIFAAFRAGAVGYLRKEMRLSRLPAALLGVLNGEAAIPRDVTARLLGEYRRRGRVGALGHAVRGVANLSARETDVLELFLEGLGTDEIGRRLFLSPPTVRSHLAAVMRKLGVRGRDALRELWTTSEAQGAPETVGDTLDLVGPDAGIDRQGQDLVSRRLGVGEVATAVPEDAGGR
jgi:DNA-binding NarL/FixJ family response regulator